MHATRVVVTGMGVVSPLGNDVKRMWSSVAAGRSGVGPITAFDPSPFPARVAAEVRDFDARAWVKPKTLRRSGRAAQFALAAAGMALEDAGWTSGPAGTNEAAVILGGGYGSMANVEEAYRVFFTEDWRRNAFLTVPMSMPNAPGSQVALEYRLRGPSYTISAACASGAAAIGNAAQLLRAGIAPRALAGGVDAMILPGVFSAWCLLGVLSERNHDPAGACAPFSRDREGLVFGEGACVLALETLADAERRGARVYAEIAGIGSTCDGENVTAPALEGEVAAIRTALLDAGLRPDEVGYVNAHGTGTKLNDALETRALKAAFGDHVRRLAVSSSKSMLGHMMGASSAIECAIAALALEEQLVPPTINLREPDPECDLDYVPGRGRPASLEAALSNSFAFGGSNVILALRRHRA